MEKKRKTEPSILFPTKTQYNIVGLGGLEWGIKWGQSGYGKNLQSQSTEEQNIYKI